MPEQPSSSENSGPPTPDIFSPPPEPGFVPSPSGLLVPQHRDPGSGLVLPENLRGLALPKNPRSFTVLQAGVLQSATGQELKQIRVAHVNTKTNPDKTDNPTFALYDLSGYLRQRIESHVSDPAIISHVQHAMNPNVADEPYEPSLLHRPILEKSFYNYQSGQPETRTVSEANPLEQAATIMLDVATNPIFANTNIIFRTCKGLSTMLENTRQALTPTAMELPELPSLMEKILETLPKLNVEKGSRYQLYDVCDTTNIPEVLD